MVAAAKGVKVGHVPGEGRGYFKLVDGSSHHSLVANNGIQVTAAVCTPFTSIHLKGKRHKHGTLL